MLICLCYRLSGSMSSIVMLLQQALGSDSRTSEQYYKLIQLLGQPKPFPGSLAAELLIKARHLSKLITVKPGIRNNLCHVLGLLQSDGTRVRTKLIHVICCLWNKDFEAIEGLL